MTTTAELIELRDALGSLSGGVAVAERVDRIRLLEEIKSAAAAAQAIEIVAFGDEARQANIDAGEPGERADRGVASQVGLAMRLSHFRARRQLGWARILTRELPQTFAELAAGRTTEWRAMLVARETAWLSVEHRAAVDAELAPRLEGWGDQRVEAETAKAAARLDPAGAVAKAANATKDRRVSLRPAPDTMCRLSSLLPVAAGVAAYASLGRAADALIGTGAAGDRNRGQVMADLLIERLTGRSVADGIGVEVEVLMTDLALLSRPGTAGRDEPAHLQGYGPVPARWARHLLLNTGGPRWLRRLYQHPSTGELAAMDSRRRTFTENQIRFLRLRDQTCSTPWCDAPIRHGDHVVPWAHDRSTTVLKGQGLCAACNYAKQAPGWRQAMQPGPGWGVLIVTPTGHRYRARPPDPPRGEDQTSAVRGQPRAAPTGVA